MDDKDKGKTYAEEHPEQDPAEGSREVIDHDLRRAGEKEGAAKQAEKGKPRSN